MHTDRASTSFGPETVDDMALALDLAWNFVRRTDLDSADGADVREFLARQIFLSARLGETRKVALANDAIRRLREVASSQPRLWPLRRSGSRMQKGDAR